MARDVDPPDMATLRKALGEGDPLQIRALVDQGADLHYRDAHGYGALLDAIHGRDVFIDPRLPELIQLLVEHRVDLNQASSHGESGLRVLSRLGRFDGVQQLLAAGADESQLGWTPLIRAVAMGTLDDVRCLLDRGAPLEERDVWSRTAWLVALQSGDLAKALLLAERGADLEAVGRCGKPPLFYPIACRRMATLRWLLDFGIDIERTDDFGGTALLEAAEVGWEEGVDVLVKAGARLEHEHHGSTALGVARTRGIITRLLDAGADPRRLGNEGRRILMGWSAEPDIRPLEGVSRADFVRARTRRYGVANPERMEEPFWVAMIRSGENGFMANEHFHGPSSFGGEPVWCAQRFGQSLTVLPDGRMVLIGGEHEDSYDPDFCIYNDVFVREIDGSVSILGYPESVFPPTDFHTATRVADAIYIIGALGYPGRREHGRTPVYRLDLRSWRIDRVEPTGPCPGWIHGHRATRIGGHGILVTGGTVLVREGHEEVGRLNDEGFVLEVQDLVWRPQGSSSGGA